MVFQRSFIAAHGFFFCGVLQVFMAFKVLFAVTVFQWCSIGIHGVSGVSWRTSCLCSVCFWRVEHPFLIFWFWNSMFFQWCFIGAPGFSVFLAELDVSHCYFVGCHGMQWCLIGVHGLTVWFGRSACFFVLFSLCAHGFPMFFYRCSWFFFYGSFAELHACALLQVFVVVQFCVLYPHVFSVFIFVEFHCCCQFVFEGSHGLPMVLYMRSGFSAVLCIWIQLFSVACFLQVFIVFAIVFHMCSWLFVCCFSLADFHRVSMFPRRS